MQGVSIRLKGLAVAPPDSPAAAPILGPIDFEVAAGEHVLVVGPSGSGKTTLLRAVAGLAVPSAGTVQLDGQAVSAAGTLLLPPERRSVSMLFQGAALWPHMSAGKTLVFALKLAGKRGPAAEAEARTLLERVGLAGFHGRMPATLSGGERQRLALARALAASPRVLLLDEPLAPLDSALRESLLDVIEDLRSREGWTVLHVSHDPEGVRDRADRTVHLAAGKIEAAP